MPLEVIAALVDEPLATANCEFEYGPVLPYDARRSCVRSLFRPCEKKALKSFQLPPVMHDNDTPQLQQLTTKLLAAGRSWFPEQELDPRDRRTLEQ